MDRAAKLKKYGKKRGNRQGRRRNRALDAAGLAAWLGMGTAGAAVLLVCLGALLFLARYRKKEEAALAYVTKGELASCMSFLAEDALPKRWAQETGSYVTQGQMEELLQNIGLAGTVSATGGNGRLKRETVMDCYEQILDYLDLEGAVRKETVLVLSQDGKSCQTQDGEWKAGFDMLALGLEEFHTYSAYRLGKTILGVRAESEKTVALRQALIRSVSDGKVSVGYQGREYEIGCKDEKGLLELENAGAGYCTLCVKGGVATKIKNIQTGKDPEGQKQAKKEAQSTQAKAMPKTVKVLLLNQGKVHYGQIYLTCDGAWAVKKNRKKTAHQKSETLSIKKLKIKNGKFAVMEPSDSKGRLFLTDSKGRPISKGYYGSMTVYKDAEGYYIVNKVDIEKYLYSVVASEMPAYFGLEALKAQAVCARSYVYRQMAAGDYSKYHAQIDDSTNYQVYNQSDASEADIQAVEATAGEVMYARDEIVNAYYFSSSFGRTSSMEIWGQDEGEYPYLKIKSLNPAEQPGKKLDLSDEEAFKKYMDAKDTGAFDSGSRYYRWTAKAEPSICQAALKEKIKQRKKANPDQVTFYSTAKKKAKKVPSMRGFGGVKKMYCTKRGKSGAILVLTIRFEFGKVEIRSEYNIRAVIGCALEQITYADGNVDTASRFLPSAYFSMSFDPKSKRYLLSGGGNGHGMGMSQYGAAGMAKEGWGYKKILTFFYDGVKVRRVP